MHPEQQRNDERGSGQVDLIRGVLVIITAVAIGFFVLTQGLDDTESEAAAAGSPTLEASTDVAQPTDAASEGTGSSSTIDPAAGTVAVDPNASSTTVEGAMAATTTTPAGPEIRAPGDVAVLVLNGEGTKGVAAQGSEVVKAAGYQMLAPKNRDGLGPSQVLYLEGYEAEARSIAELFGPGAAATVAAYSSAASPVADIGAANVVVVMGTDGLISA